jgi:hypothetical protein
MCKSTNWKANGMAMPRLCFNATLLACIRVEAETRAEAEHKLRQSLTGSKAILGTLEGEPIVATIEIEGELDLIDVEKRADNYPKAQTSPSCAPPVQESRLVEPQRIVD